MNLNEPKHFPLDFADQQGRAVGMQIMIQEWGHGKGSLVLRFCKTLDGNPVTETRFGPVFYAWEDPEIGVQEFLAEAKRIQGDAK